LPGPPRPWDSGAAGSWGLSLASPRTCALPTSLCLEPCRVLARNQTVRHVGLPGCARQPSRRSVYCTRCGRHPRPTEGSTGLSHRTHTAGRHAARRAGRRR
jgi:hypothetical protein